MTGGSSLFGSGMETSATEAFVVSVIGGGVDGWIVILGIADVVAKFMYM